MKAIKVDNLTFGYVQNHKVLDDISFCIEDASVNVLLGLNGSGKTTLIKLLAGLLKPNSGEITVKDKAFNKLSPHERSKLISYVAQRSGSVDDFTVRAYLLFGSINQFKFYERPKREHEDKANIYAERFGISKLLDKNLGQLSGGERQIVSICAAMIQDSPIVILDEPTSALDISNQHRVLKLLREIAQVENKTFVLSTHNPNHALYLDANVILLKNGKIANQGTAKQLITVDNLKSIYGNELCLSKDLPYKEISFMDKVEPNSKEGEK